MAATPPSPPPPHRAGSDLPFFLGFGVLGGTYLVLIVGMLAAEAAASPPALLLEAFRSPEIRHATRLSLASASLTALLSLWVAVPLGYLMSRFAFPGKALLDALIDVPIVLPPLVVGLALLLLFQTPPGRWFQQSFFHVSLQVPAVVLAQFAVSAAFAVRTLRVTFDQIDRRQEDVALTLGCTRAQAFWAVVFPQAWRGLLTAATLAWARALGEFGPVLVFAGTTRMRTEVLPTTVFLELSVGNLEAALGVSLFMVAAAALVLVLTRTLGLRSAEGRP